LFQYLFEALPQFKVTLILGILQKLFYLIKTRATKLLLLLLDQLGFLGLLVSDFRPGGLSMSTCTEAPGIV
jgi:hypothetical protein